MRMEEAFYNISMYLYNKNVLKYIYSLNFKRNPKNPENFEVTAVKFNRITKPDVKKQGNNNNIQYKGHVTFEVVLRS